MVPGEETALLWIRFSGLILTLLLHHLPCTVQSNSGIDPPQSPQAAIQEHCLHGSDEGGGSDGGGDSD